MRSDFALIPGTALVMVGRWNEKTGPEIWIR